MNIRGRLNRVEREAWKKGIARKLRRVHYVAVYGQEPGETGPPEIAFEFETTELDPGGPSYDRDKTNEN